MYCSIISKGDFSNGFQGIYIASCFVFEQSCNLAAFVFFFPLFFLLPTPLSWRPEIGNNYRKKNLICPGQSAQLGSFQSHSGSNRHLAKAVFSSLFFSLPVLFGFRSNYMVASPGKPMEKSCSLYFSNAM